MSRIFRLFIFLLVIGFPAGAARAQVAEGTATPTITMTPTPAPAEVIITSPLPGQALQGNVTISGNTLVEGFQAMEIAFTYHDSAIDTWFLIQESSTPVSYSTLAHWDTTTITDGTYDLRLAVTLVDGSQKTYIAQGVRVRNYTAIETLTPTPVTPTSTPLPGDTPVPSETPTPTQSPIPLTPTALPPNPAVLSRGDINQSLAKGGLVTVGLFALVGIYRGLKQLRKQR